MHQTSASGKFVGQVRCEYLGILQNVVENCFVKKIFQTAQAAKIIDYIRQKYHNELEYLWNKFPEDAVIRRRDNRKWYAVFMVIDGTKLGLKSGRIEVMNLRTAPDNINNLIDRQTYFAGYHMNKQHWITVVLDKSAPLPEILQLLDTSYNLAAKKIISEGEKNFSVDRPT